MTKKTIVVFTKEELVLDAIAYLLLSAGYGVLTFTSTWAFLEHGKRSRCDYLVCSEKACGITANETMRILQSTGWNMPTILINQNGEALVTASADNEAVNLAALLENFAESRSKFFQAA